MSHKTEWVTAAVSGDEGAVDIVAETAAVLAEHDLHPERRGHDLFLPDSGLVLSPRGLEIPRGEGQGTVSIVRATHPTFPEGVFEYQHGSGPNLRASVRFGLDQWAQLDLPVLLDAVRETPEICMMLKMETQANGVQPERTRRVLLGPTAHFTQPPSSPAADPEGEEEHSFCPCCLLLNSMNAFRSLVYSDETLGVRLFAARDVSGRPTADCRINGQDFEEGEAALRAYVETWPERGFEFRKQYVIFQNAV